MIFSAAIFDLDGTLIDSNAVWEKLDRIILERRGISCTDSFIRSLAAMTYAEAASAIRSAGTDMTEEALTRELNGLAEYEYAHNISLKEGAGEYLRLLHGRGIKIALATASPPELYVPVLKRWDVYRLFSAFVTTDEAGRGKEHPDVYLKAAEKLGVPPKDCAVFEDVLKGILSASRAGMKTVGVFDSYSSNDWEKIKEVSAIYVQSFKELL